MKSPNPSPASRISSSKHSVVRHSTFTLFSCGLLIGVLFGVGPAAGVPAAVSSSFDVFIGVPAAIFLAICCSFAGLVSFLADSSWLPGLQSE